MLRLITASDNGACCVEQWHAGGQAPLLVTARDIRDAEGWVYGPERAKRVKHCGWFLQMRYTVVETDFGDEETKSFNKHGDFNDVTNLYEVKKLAAISGDLENDENEEPGMDRPDPSIIAEGNEKWLAIAVKDDVSVFRTNFDLEYFFTHQFKDGGNICGIGWIGNSDILAIVSSIMEITFLSAPLKAVLTSISLPSTSHCKRAYISSEVVNHICYLSVAREDGETFTLKFAEWFSMESANVERIVDACKISFENHHCARALSSIPLIDVVSNGETVVTIPKTHAPLQLSRAESEKMDSLGDKETAVLFVRVRYYSNGRFIIGLTAEGLFVVIDLWTYSVVLRKNIKTNPEEIFTDFIMLNKPGVTLTLGMVAVIVKTGELSEVHIRSLRTCETTYRVEISYETTLVPVSEVADRAILLVESFPDKDTDTVKVREIVEAQPEMKLERLIERNQLDEAEQFAIQFKLDLQKVYVARMSYLLSLATVSNSDEHFSQLMNSFEKVKDHNLVGEVCFSGATTFDSYERIISLLAYAKKRAITDPEMIDHLSEVSYLLETYCLVQGPENAKFDADSMWTYFLSGMQNEGQWHEIFLYTLGNGLVKEARVIWNRHIASLTPFFNSAENIEMAGENLSNFFKILREAISKDLGIWRDVIAFLEFDFVTAYLWKIPRQISALLVEFLLDLARELEMLDWDNFPLNSLHVVSTFERIIKKHVEETVTGMRQAELAYMGSQICSNADGTESVLGELVTYSANLKAIDRLKTVYQCPLSYSAFVSLNSEELCFQILQRCVQNPNLVKENVEKYARPYMAEHNLDQDETLYKYIDAVSSRSRGVIVTSNAWHDHCLVVCETIHRLSVRSKAICVIAKGAHPPWNRRLSEAVESVLNNRHVDQTIKDSLEKICRRAEIGQIMMAYSTPIGMLDSVFKSEYNFIAFIRLMFTDDRHNISQRLIDAIKVVDLYHQLYEHYSPLVSHLRINVMFADHLRKTKSSDPTVLQFLENLRAEKGDVFDDIVSELIDTWKRKIDSSSIIWTESAITQRMHLIETVQSVILHFMNGNSYYMEFYYQLSSIRQLQERHSMYVVTKQLEFKDWKESTLKNFILCEERSLHDIYSFSKVLGMSRDEASCLSIKLAVDSGNSMGALTVIRDALRNVPNASHSLAEACVRGCEFVLWCVQEIAGNPNSAFNADIVQQANDSIVILSRVLPILEPVTNHSLEPLEAVTRMYGYVDIFLQVVKQCMLEDTNDNSGEKESEKKNDLLENDGSRIYGVRRRVGVYHMRNEGPLFARMEAIANISSVARSAVGASNLADEVKIKLYSEQAAKWSDFFNFLSLSNQDLLEFQARVYATTLPCWEYMEEKNRPGFGLRCPVRNVCLRALLAHPCDLWTPCTLLSSLPPSVIEEVILELRTIVVKRKSPQTMINYLRIVQFTLMASQNITHAKMLTDAFTNALWAKRLGKAGLPQTLPQKSIDAAIPEFAKHKVDPDVVSEFVDEFCGTEQLPSCLLRYAIELVQLASSSNDKRDISALLEIAYRALKVNEVPISREKLFLAFRDLLYIVSPYNYAVLRFITSHLKSTCDEGDQEFITGCSLILDFLTEYRRRDSISKVELSWFNKREKQMASDKKNPSVENFGAYCRCLFENGTRQNLYNTTNDVSSPSYMQQGEEHNMYEQDTVMVVMPDEAKRRLPLHPFLYLATGDIEQFLCPIIEEELNIYNVLDWQALVRNVPWLKSCTFFSRSHLLSTAVGKICAEVVSKDEDLPCHDLKAVNDLLMHTSSRKSVVNCIAMCFKKLPLCETKIRLIEMGRLVAQHWLATSDIEPPMDENERMAIEEQVNRLSTAIEKYSTELILKKNGLYSEKTCDLIESPAELICYIYSNSIDWKSQNEREKQMEVVEQLARVNNIVNLAQIQENLVISWLIADKVEETYSVDPNDTMGSAGLDIPMSTSNDDEVFLSPFFDVDIDRIVYVLRRVNMGKILPDLVSYMKETIVRAACVLLRAYTNEQLKKANYDHLRISVDLEVVLYGRLLDLAHVDIPLDTFRREEKSAIVRGLVAPGARWTPQLAFLVASLIIDYEIADCSLVEMILNRLQSAQKREMFVELLSYCRQEKRLRRLRNLARLWARAAEWSLSRIEHVKDELRDEFERWFYFAISCPAEGDRALDSVRSILRKRKYAVAAYLIGVIGSSTQRCPPFDFTTIDPEQDVVFKWITDVMEKTTIEQ
ncbi:hypothetical protein KIN20_009370 [Parelaphostrongylus tenuis]|uniref:RZZ complex subunit KNTC1/ROD C-terminal domain-containing protein n=1 Tax=Parelaphostrongylus tenuis TaxID=148309 RepID=A0AAD5MSG0_PARTN|nr:hypothetical protein KIN20_009370 [Parelaphostrongylus tenuis]